MRIIKITGGMPIPNEAKKFVEDPYLKIKSEHDYDVINLKVIAFESIEDLKANNNPIATYEGLKIPHSLTIATKEGEAPIILDGMDTFNVEKEIGQIVSTTFGTVGNNRIIIKEDEVEHYQISKQFILEQNNEGTDVIDKASLFVAKMLKSKIEQNYASRIADGKITNIEILEI